VQEKARLAKEYEAATAAFSEAVKELNRRIGTSPKEEYKRLERISSEARVKSEQTRLALEQQSPPIVANLVGRLRLILVSTRNCDVPDSVIPPVCESSHFSPVKNGELKRDFPQPTDCVGCGIAD
jgi:hypothetical protein